MTAVPTITVTTKGGGRCVINEADFDAKVHTRIDANSAPAPPPIVETPAVETPAVEIPEDPETSRSKRRRSGG